MEFRNQDLGVRCACHCWSVTASQPIDLTQLYIYHECVLMPLIQTQLHSVLLKLSLIHNCPTLYFGIIGFNLLNKWFGSDDVQVTFGPGVFSGCWFCKALWPPLTRDSWGKPDSQLSNRLKGRSPGSLCKAKSKKTFTGPGCLGPELIKTCLGPGSSGQIAGHQAKVSRLHSNFLHSPCTAMVVVPQQTIWTQIETTTKCKMKRRFQN